jgi:hypothetical protein
VGAQLKRKILKAGMAMNPGHFFHLNGNYFRPRLAGVREMKCEI